MTCNTQVNFTITTAPDGCYIEAPWWRYTSRDLVDTLWPWFSYEGRGLKGGVL